MDPSGPYYADLVPQEEWWVHDLRARRFLRRVVPISASRSSDPRKSVVAAKAIPGTPFILVEWGALRAFGFPQDSAQGRRVTLVDAVGTVHWAVDLAGDATKSLAAPPRTTTPAMRHGALGEVPSEGRFALFDVAPGRRREFALERDAASDWGWTVRETGSAPFVVPSEGDVRRARADRALAEIPENLLHAGRIALVVADAAVEPQRPIVAMDVDSAGTIYAAAAGSGRIHAFTADGRIVRTFASTPGTTEGSLRFGHMTCRDDGEVWLVRSSIANGAYVRFASTGALLDSDWKSDGRMRGRSYLQPGSDRRWSRGWMPALLLFDSANEVEARIERAKDRSWLDDVYGAGVAPDGSLAVVHAVSRDGITTENRVAVFSADGAPRSSMSAPPWVPGLQDFAFDGSRFAFFTPSRERGWVVLCDSKARPIAKTPATRRGTAARPYLLPNLGELWVFDGATTIDRYELPR